MTAPRTTNSSEKGQDFERHAKERSSGILGEYWHFLRTSNKWYILPTIVLLLVLGLLVVLSASGLAPFIYAMW
jgi:hypothetical protein